MDGRGGIGGCVGVGVAEGGGVWQWKSGGGALYKVVPKVSIVRGVRHRLLNQWAEKEAFTRGV